MNYTDTQLKQALAKMLPELLENYYQDTPLDNFLLSWTRSKREVLNTELLHLCWLVEETIKDNIGYCRILLETCLPELRGIIVGLNAGFGMSILHATWQQRVTALAKVKGVEIV